MVRQCHYYSVILCALDQRGTITWDYIPGSGHQLEGIDALGKNLLASSGQKEKERAVGHEVKIIDLPRMSEKTSNFRMSDRGVPSKYFLPRNRCESC